VQQQAGGQQGLDGTNSQGPAAAQSATDTPDARQGRSEPAGSSSLDLLAIILPIVVPLSVPFAIYAWLKRAA
jgi:hypothetical protein